MPVEPHLNDETQATDLHAEAVGGDAPIDPPDQRTGGHGWAIGLLFVILALAFAYRAVAALRFGLRFPPPLDDAYMFCRYADHLLRGWGLAWNPDGVQTYGCTSLLYTFWIAGLRVVTDRAWPELLAIGSWIPGVLAVVVTGLACSRVGRVSLFRRRLAGISFAMLCVVVQGGYFFHLRSGMDTTTAMLLNALLVFVVVHPRFPESLPRACLAAGVAWLAFLARPDSLIYVVCFGLGVALLCRERGRRTVRGALVFAGALVVLLAIDAAVKHAVFGSALPLPFYAKSRGFYEGYVGAAQWNPYAFMRYFLFQNGVAVAVLLLAVGRRSWRLTLAVLVACLLTWGYYATVVQIMGYRARFYYPFMPFLIVAAYRALDGRWPVMLAGGPRWRREAVEGLLLTGIACGVFALFSTSGMMNWQTESIRSADVGRQRVANYRPESVARHLGLTETVGALSGLMDSCAPEAAWAMSEHGLLGAQHPLTPILDLVGLHDRATLTGESVVDHLFAERPDVIWFPHPAYRGMIAAMETRPEFRAEYDYWPGAFEYGIAVRRSSPCYLTLLGAMQQVWPELYGRSMPAPASPR